MSNEEYWSNRYERAGNVGTVCREASDDDAYFRGAMRVWDVAGKVVKEAAPDSILDVGCGPGRFTPFLRGCCHEYCGVDIAEHAIKTARIRYGSSLTTQFFQMIDDGKKLPARWDSPFDLVWTCVVLQHITNEKVLRSLIKQITATCSPDASFVMTETMNDHVQKHPHVKFRTAKWYKDMMKELGWRLAYELHVKEATTQKYERKG